MLMGVVIKHNYINNKNALENLNKIKVKNGDNNKDLTILI
jgi:hypothetical protein